MKASEAIAILESLDPNHEVTLVLGNRAKQTFPQNPMWNQTQPYWAKGIEWPLPMPLNHITCKTVH